MSMGIDQAMPAVVKFINLAAIAAPTDEGLLLSLQWTLWLHKNRAFSSSERPIVTCGAL